MASYFKRADGAIEVQIRVRGYPNFNRTYANKTIARREAQKIEGAMRAGTWKDDREADRTLLSTVITEYRKRRLPMLRSHDAKHRINQTEAKWGQFKLTAVTPKMVAAWKQELIEANYAPVTVNNRIAALSAIFTFAIKEMHVGLDTNPVSLVSYEAPKPRKKRRRLREGEEIKLLEAMTKPQPVKTYKYGKTYGRRDYTMIRQPSLAARCAVILAIETGMREGEIAALRRDKCFLDNLYLVTEQTKNGDEREIPLSPRAIETIKDVMQIVGEHELICGGTSPEMIYDALRRSADSIGSRDLDFHSLRHEAASRLADLYEKHELQKIMGWKSEKMVNIYYKPRASDLARRLHDGLRP